MAARRSCRRTAIALLLAIAAVVAPGLRVAPQQAGSTAPVVFAAASLKTALDAIGNDWQRETGGKVTLVYGSSSSLARQVEQGAPADVFFSADLEWMDWLQRRGLIAPETRTALLGNALVLVAPTDSAVALKMAPGASLAAALGGGRLAITEVKSTPAGKYARAALEALGLWAGVEGKLAQSDTVRAALALVARGEARLGIVYATDARTEPKVKIVDIFPASTHPPIVYPVALTSGSANVDAARFLAYLKSQAAAARFVEQGFSILGN